VATTEPDALSDRAGAELLLWAETEERSARIESERMDFILGQTIVVCGL
jgi:hypothetical protein